MTNQNQNNAAQAAEQDLIDRLTEIANRDTAVAVTVRADDLRALLSKLRAPVADERAQHDNWYSRTHMHEYSRDATWRGWKARAALASAPVAELRLEWSAKALYDAIKDVLLNHRLSNLVDEDGEFFPLVDHLCSQDDKTTESGEFEIALICDAIYNDVLTKSAPVAGEAQVQQPVAYTDSCGHLHWTNGRRILVSLYAAPQASAENVRNAALEALEAAQRFIRNGIEFGYIRMPGADTPDPAHRTPGLIDTAISALKTQADKDGGQQRACTCHPDDRPAGDCQQQYAASECQQRADESAVRRALVAASNYIDTLGGDSKSYRAALSATQPEQGERD